MSTTTLQEGPEMSESPSPEELLVKIDERVAKLVKDPDDIEDKTPELVWQKYQDHYVEEENRQSGLDSVESAWRQFMVWMDEKGYEYLSDLTENFAARHDDWITSHPEIDKNRLSRNIHLSRIKQPIDHARSRGWIHPADVPEPEEWDNVKPDVDKDEKVRSDPLPPERGHLITQYVRNNHYGERPHAIWILIWRFAFRISAIRALDRSDLILQKPDDWPDYPGSPDYPGPHLRLKDRPHLGDPNDKGLPLKNKNENLAGRRVPLEPEDAEVLRTYRDNHRKEHDKPDKYDLCGLFSGKHGPRLGGRRIRSIVKWLTSPGTYGSVCECQGCSEYRRNHDGSEPYPSKLGRHCNESRAPHQCRHGAITVLLDDKSPDLLSRICGTSGDTLLDKYDRAGEYRKLERIFDSWVD